MGFRASCCNSIKERAEDDDDESTVHQMPEGDRQPAGAAQVFKLRMADDRFDLVTLPSTSIQAPPRQSELGQVRMAAFGCA